MRLLTAAIILLALTVAGGTVHAAAQRRPPAVVVGAFDPKTKEVTIIGGYVGRKWLSSEQTNGLLRNGDRMDLYGLEEGKLGQVVLSSNGTRLSTTNAGWAVAKGLRFTAALHLDSGQQQRFARARARGEAVGRNSYFDLGRYLLVAWSRGRQPPRWIPATTLSDSSARKAVASFLQTRKTPPASIRSAVIAHAVGVDFDGDGAQEHFLSFHHAGSDLQYVDRPRPDQFCYFLMQRPSGSGPRRTTVLQNNVPLCAVIGVMDMNDDGVGELLVHRSYPDNDMGDIIAWTKKGFVFHYGWGFSS